MRTKLIIRIDGIGFKLCLSCTDQICINKKKGALNNITEPWRVAFICPSTQVQAMSTHIPNRVLRFFQTIRIDFSDIILLPKPLYSFVFETSKSEIYQARPATYNLATTAAISSSV